MYGKVWAAVFPLNVWKMAGGGEAHPVLTYCMEKCGQLCACLSSQRYGKFYDDHGTGRQKLLPIHMSVCSTTCISSVCILHVCLCTDPSVHLCCLQPPEEGAGPQCPASGHHTCDCRAQVPDLNSLKTETNTWLFAHGITSAHSVVGHPI